MDDEVVEEIAPPVSALFAYGKDGVPFVVLTPPDCESALGGRLCAERSD